MIRLINALGAWGTGDFDRVLKSEVEQLDAAELPLQQGLSTASYAIGDGFRVMIISSWESEGLIQTKAGIFYSGIISGCNCADDTPVETQPEYCEVQIDIDAKTARTTLTLLPEIGV